MAIMGVVPPQHASSTAGSRSDEAAARGLAREAGLDAIRGLAITLVLASHFIPGLASAGWMGVTMFFVLSGFLITRLLLKEIDQTGNVDLRAFYIRRAGRLVPELVAVVSVVSVVGTMTGERNALMNAVVSLSYTTDLIVAAGGLLGPVTHTWSLAVEEQFYLIWPIAISLLVAHLSRPLLVIAAIAVAALMWRGVMVVAGVEPGRYFGPDGQLDALMAGCGLALVTSTGRTLAPSRALVIVGALVIGVAAATQEIGGVALQAIAGVPLTLAGTVVLIAAVRASRAAWLCCRPLARLGIISYSVYLWHVPILLAIWATLGQQIAPTILALVVTFTVASASHRFASPIRLWARGARNTLVPSMPDVTPVDVAFKMRSGQRWGDTGNADAIPIATSGATQVLRVP